VDEFSAFARMPKPVIEAHDVNDVVREALVLFQMSSSQVTYTLDIADQPLIAHCDRRLLNQAMTNLIKNASEAVEAAAQVKSEGGEGDYKGQVTARVTAQDQSILIEVIDNGCGLPKEDRHRLIEPYVTTRQKGTGLGLAIVQKIIEQHQGTLALDDAVPSADTEAGETRGARISITLPLGEPVPEGGNRDAGARSGSSQQQGGKRTATREKQGVSDDI